MSRFEKTSTINNFFLAAAAFSGGLSVVLGAFAAHALKNSLSASYLQTFQTGVDYQFLHSLALLGVALLPQSHRLLKLAGWFFIFGIILFSGSLYVLSLSEIRFVGMITPVGGASFIAGWLSLLFFAWAKQS